MQINVLKTLTNLNRKCLKIKFTFITYGNSQVYFVSAFMTKSVITILLANYKTENYQNHPT